LTEGLQGLFRKAREKIGFVPNVFRAYSFRPERLRAWFAHYRQLHEPTDNLGAAGWELSEDRRDGAPRQRGGKDPSLASSRPGEAYRGMLERTERPWWRRMFGG
jgi:hypothetical protein